MQVKGLDVFRNHWLVFTALVLATLLSAVVAGLLVWRDREDAVARAEERTSSISRLIIAHAEAAAAVADRILAVAVPPVTAWNLTEEPKAAQIADLLRMSVGENDVVASAAVIDAAGNVLITSRSYPAKPLNIADRPFMIGHRAGLADPLIMGDPAPGPISGKKRFTFSRAIRNPDGSIHAILSAALQTASFDVLYKEVASWPDAEAGLYAMGGDILAQVQKAPRSSRSFLKVLEAHIAASGSSSGGTAVLANGQGPELVSWSVSGEYPGLYSATSEPMDDVLRTWRTRTFTTVMLVALGNILLWAFSLVAIRMSSARRAAELHELSAREVHHRLKNSLQLISSLIRMRSANLKEAGARKAVDEILVDLQSVAKIHSLLQNVPGQGHIDLAESLTLLCEHLRATYRVDITLSCTGTLPVNAGHATGLSIILNELVTNAIKHGGGNVMVFCAVKDGALLLRVLNDGRPLPEDFTIGEGGSFGLRAVNAMVKGFKGNLAASNLPDGRVQFAITMPQAELMRQ